MTAEIVPLPPRWYYVKLDWQWRRHHERFRRYVQAHGLPCQDCRGCGSHHEVVISETGEGPDYECGWCEGTGKVTRHLRGLWLREKRRDR